MFMNRLRYDDFINILEKMNHDIVQIETSNDSRVKDILTSKI